ncbi:MAG TPA: extracellular solute-binding protein [Opitutaceae bacterium]|nr:extracellular solute-binding protein [Opitutaceae bacterium]
MRTRPWTDAGRWFARAAAAIGCLVLAVPGRGGTTLDIPVFAGGYGLSFYEETARQFEALEAARGVKVHLYGDPRIHDKISVRAIGGDFPDAAAAAYVPWPALIRAGKVIDLRRYLDGPNWEGDARWRDTFYPGALESWEVDGHICGLPFTYACWTIFYNRSLFRAHGWTPPRTWDEFFALCDRMKAAGITPLSLAGTHQLYPEAFLRAAFYSRAGSAGWKALNALAPGARTSPAYLEAAALLQRITRQDTIRGWEGATHTGAQLAFLEGRTAMTVSGSWMLNEMAGKVPDGFELGAMNFPVFPDGRGDPTAIQTSSDCFFVFAKGDPRRERLTIDFLRYLTSRRRAEAFVREMDSPVAVRGVPRVAFSPRMRDTYAMIEQARSAFNMPQAMLQPPALLEALNDARFRLMTGAMTPREFGRRLEDAAATDRRRMADPLVVDDRHPVAGTLLLAGILATAVWLFGAERGRRRFARDTALAGLVPPDSPRPRPAAETASFGPLRARMAATFVGPAFALYAVLVLLPGATAFLWAFTHWDGLGPRTWTGWFNFRELLFESDTFWSALRNNLFLTVVPTLLVVPVALLLAAVIHRGVIGGRVFRVVFLFPNLLGGIAATLLWLNAYEPHGGLVNAGLVALGRLIHSEWLQSFDGFPWLTPDHLYAALVPIYLWMACGFNLILYLAAMEGIDPQLYEAAELDGASRVRQFFSVTLPMIWDLVGISAVFLVIAGLNAFEMVWLLTSQEPAGSSHTLGTLLVTTMFKYFEVGRAAALAVILLVLVLLASGVVLRVLRREPVGD